MGLRSRSCLLLLLMVVVLLVPAALAQMCGEDPAGDPCVLSCLDCSTGDMVPDPENCHGYYICESGEEDGYIALPFECSGDDVFIYDDQACGQGNCTVCDVPTGPTCLYECGAVTPDDIFVIPSPTDCGSYYTCGEDNTTSGFETCPAETPFFDGTECQTDEKRCCHCHAYCSVGDSVGLIADPQDCRRYYLCTAANEAPTNSGTCPEGENFDSILEGCSATAECNTEPYCRNVVGLDGCIEPFTCEATGYFARCPGQCTADFYHCTAATGEYQDAETCDSGVFHPDSHTCVSSEDCP